jgi:hypothetical protein
MTTATDARPSRRPRFGGCLRALATYDVFPAISAKVRRLLYNPLGVLLLAALTALLCGLFLHAQGFVLLGGLLSVMLAGLACPWLSLRGLRGALSFGQPRASEGDRVEVRLTLRNRLPWAAWGLAVRGGFNPGDCTPDPPTAGGQHCRRTSPPDGPVPLDPCAAVPGRLPAGPVPADDGVPVRPVGERPAADRRGPPDRLAAGAPGGAGAARRR